MRNALEMFRIHGGQDEGARAFAEALNPLHHRRAGVQGLRQHHRQVAEEGEVGAELAIHLADGGRHVVGLMVELQRVVQIAHRDDHARDAAKFPRHGFTLRIGAGLAFGEILNQEGEEGAAHAAAHVGGLPFELHAVRTRASAARGGGDRYAGCLQAGDFGGQIRRAHRPRARSRLFLEKFGPDVRVDRRWVCVGLDAHQLQIRAIREAHQRHFRGVIAVRAARNGFDAHGTEPGLHGAQVRAGDGDVVEFGIGGGEEGGEGCQEEREAGHVLIVGGNGEQKKCRRC